MKLYLLILFLFIAAVIGLVVYFGVPKGAVQTTYSLFPAFHGSVTQTAPLPNTLISEPLGKAASRVTKKPFAIFVSPGESPITPERFSGYHTGADFEVSSSEERIDVPVFAICDGTLKLKKSAEGYGGVAVESCKIAGEDVTVVYGHIRLSSIAVAEGAAMTHGQKFAVLGTGYGAETDGERKHLHLGIHKGTAVDIAGYVPDKADLSGWIDPLSIIPK